MFSHEKVDTPDSRRSFPGSGAPFRKASKTGLFDIRYEPDIDFEVYCRILVRQQTQPLALLANDVEGIDMNQQNLVDSGNTAVAEADYQRQDLRKRDIVNHGIAVQESSNTVAAIEYLKSHDIDSVVIARVLLEPQRRRSPTHH